MQATQSKPSPGQLGESHPVSRINVANICFMQKTKQNKKNIFNLYIRKVEIVCFFIFASLCFLVLNMVWLVKA